MGSSSHIKSMNQHGAVLMSLCVWGGSSCLFSAIHIEREHARVRGQCCTGNQSGASRKVFGTQPSAPHNPLSDSTSPNLQPPLTHTLTAAAPTLKMSVCVSWRVLESESMCVCVCVCVCRLPLYVPVCTLTSSDFHLSSLNSPQQLFSPDRPQ